MGLYGPQWAPMDFKGLQLISMGVNRLPFFLLASIGFHGWPLDSLCLHSFQLASTGINWFPRVFCVCVFFYCCFSKTICPVCNTDSSLIILYRLFSMGLLHSKASHFKWCSLAEKFLTSQWVFLAVKLFTYYCGSLAVRLLT